MHRCLGVSPLALLAAVATTGCFGHPLDPGEIAAEEMARASQPSCRNGETVTCRCDAEGGLHVRAPAGSTLRVPDGAGHEDAEGEITLSREESQPIRRTKSLGFIGDGKLTQGPTHGGPWNAPDAVMPIHLHGGGSYGSRGGYSGASARSFGRSRPR
jgi:hypothetical protein